MKQLICLLTMVCFLGTAIGQNMETSPAKPSPGTTLTIKYNPEGTALENVASIMSVAYLLENGLPKAVEVDLQVEDNIYTATINTSAETKALFVTFTDESAELNDNNDDKGYKVKFYNADQTQPVEGTYGNIAQTYGSYYRFIGISRNNEKAMKYIKKEFTKYPESKMNKDFAVFHAWLANSAKDEEGIAQVKETIETLSEKKKPSLDELVLAHSLASTIKDQVTADELAEVINKKFENNPLQSRELYNKFYQSKEVDDRIAIYEEYSKKYGEEKNAESTLGRFASSIASSYAKKEDWDNFKKYMAMVTNKTSKASTFNNLAWNMAGAGLDGEASNLEMARDMSKQSLELVKAAKEDAENTKPDYYTTTQWKKNMKSTYGMYADTYALTLYRTGDTEGALKYQEKACKQDDFTNAEMNERYCTYYEKVKGGKDCEMLLADMIRKGAASSMMKDQHKRLFMENNTMEDAYGKYVSSLEVEAHENYKKELRKKMINKPAPDFKLTNLKGEEVSLSSLKGKVVVVDFWATWCGPCKASFPGMQRAVDKYVENDKVAFVFIDTWEKGKEKEKSASEFIEKNSYTFNVLMDNEDKVVGKFGVEGIPTKFVIDGNGHIRFKSVGFSGNDEELVSEISMMIEMASGPAKGAPGAE